MKITKWHTFLKKNHEYGYGRDIALQGDLLIGTWFCFDIVNRELIWEGPGRANAANIIVGIYENVVVAMRSSPDFFGGFYRIDLRSGRLLPDDIRLRPFLWFFKKESPVYAVVLYGNYAFLSDDTIVDVFTGERTEYSAQDILGMYSYRTAIALPADRIFVDGQPLRLPLTMGTWDNPVIRWYSFDGNYEFQTTVPGTFHMLERFTRTSGESLLILRNLLDRTIYLVYCDNDHIVSTNLQLNLQESRIRMKDDYLVLSSAGYWQKNTFHHIYRLED